MNLKKLIVLIMGVLIMSNVLAKDNNKWQSYTGKWVVGNSRVTETRGAALPWNYYELINNNSIVSLQDFSGYSSIEFTIEIFDRVKSPAEILISFGVRN